MARSAEGGSSPVPDIPVVWYHDWVKKNVPDQSGRVAIVTGGNSGVGFWCAAALAGKGAHVILACRSVEKGNAAALEILQMHPQAKVEAMCMDNMDLSSVRRFANDFKKKFPRLDLLLNNAGIMAQPKQKSVDGFDIQFQTNHLAHFLLTQLLWDRLLEEKPSGPARVVHQSSTAYYPATFTRTNMDDPPFHGCFFKVFGTCLMSALGMSPPDSWHRYGMSKLCNMLFAREIHRRVAAAGLSGRVISTTCHPGYASTPLQLKAGEAGTMHGWERNARRMAQSSADGSLPLLMAAVGPVRGGEHFGPSKSDTTGPPQIQKLTGMGNNEEMAKELWSYSEECCGGSFSIMSHK